MRVAAGVRWVLVGLSALVAVGAWVSYLRPGASGHVESGERYRCPMHPQIVSTTPGDCPICGMSLERFDGAPPAKAAATTTEMGAKRWVCPMHPEQVSDQPGRCALCKMALVKQESEAPLYACPMHAQQVSAGPGKCPVCGMPLEPISPRGAPPDAGPLPEGVVPVELTLERQQSVGVRLAPVVERMLSAPLRAPATVSPPEKGQARIHLRTAGFVDSIAVSETGVKVRAGQELFRIYSPAALEAQNELLAAQGFGEAGVRQVQAAREKLELLGMPASAISAVLQSGKPMRAFPVVTPVSGFVTKKTVVLGTYATPEEALYEITDLSRVYVIADVFSRDAADVKIGSAGVFEVAGRQGTRVSAFVDLIYPQIDPDARTTRVRMVVENDAGSLHPGTYGTVEFSRSARSALLIPRDALIDTGRQRYVFVEEGGGRFTPRAVQVGADLGNELEVVGPLTARERVVSGAAFLVDSESRLQASLAGHHSSPTSCDTQIDRQKYPDKWKACVGCETRHAGQESKLTDCKHDIAQPWK